jgi:hypothetical protein
MNAQHPDGYRYTQFCEFYRRWCKQNCDEDKYMSYGGQRDRSGDSVE